MRIGILGTRGIPNQYGGFEQFAQYLSVDLANKGHEVFVYSSSLHTYQEKEYQGVQLIHCKDFEDKIGTAGQFFYDLNCIIDSRKRNFDVLLQLGYTSSSIWGWLLPKKALVITNMDGLEWKRSKFNKPTQKFLRLAEKWAVRRSDHLVADSVGIQAHIKASYHKASTYIAYGSEIFSNPNPTVLNNYRLTPYQYYILVARMEPENNIEMILDGYIQSEQNIPFIVVGKTVNGFAQYLMKKYAAHSSVLFVGGVYDQDELNNLRYHSNMYFHGHSVGGTNPSLLEAMASSALMAAHNNIFNRSILENQAYYFSSAKEVAAILNQNVSKEERDKRVDTNLKKIQDEFSWDKINRSYENLFITLAEQKVN